MDNQNKLTTAAGNPAPDNQNVMTAGARGPVLMQDFTARMTAITLHNRVTCSVK